MLVKSLTRLVCYQYKLRLPAAKQTEYDKERIAYKKLLTEYRRRNINEYWEQQTKLENDYIDQFLEKERLRAMDMEVRMRDKTIHKTFQDTLKHQDQLKKQEKRQSALKKKFLEENIRALNRQQLLKILREESKNWYNESNLSSNLNSQVILPEAIVDETDYYFYLQEQALYLEQAQFDKLAELMNQNKALSYKNKLGVDFFQKAVALVKYLRQENPISKLEFEWKSSRSAILRDEFMKKEEAQEQLSILDDAFRTIIQEQLQQYEQDQSYRLEHLHKQLIQLYNLLEVWQKYVAVIKMNNTVAEQLAQAENQQYDLFKDDGRRTNRQSEAEAELTADEKHTSDEEEVDIEKLIKDRETNEDEQTTAEKELSRMKANLQEQPENKIYTDAIEQMIQQSAQLLDKDIDDFEEIFSKKPQIYGNLPNASQLFQSLDLEKIFPKNILKEAEDTSVPSLDLLSYEEIEAREIRKKKLYEAGTKEENPFPNPDLQKLQSLIVVEVAKEILSKIDQSQLNSRDRSLQSQSQRLLDLIAEIRIDEPLLLMKLWRIHG